MVKIAAVSTIIRATRLAIDILAAWIKEFWKCQRVIIGVSVRITLPVERPIIGAAL